MDNLIIDNFEIGDREFSLTPLTNEERLGIMPDLLGMLSPLVQSEGGVTAESLQGILQGGQEALAKLPKVSKAFTGKCKWREVNTEKWQAAGWDVCFQRRGITQLKWLAKCVSLEFSDFLAAAGLADIEGAFQGINLTSPTS